MRQRVLVFWLRMFWSGRFRKLLQVVEISEHQHHVSLSPGAVLALAAVVEDAHRRASYPSEVWGTVEHLIATMAGHPDPRDQKFSGERSGLSFLRAIRIRWCNIPPFCLPVPEEELADDRNRARE